MVSRRSLRNAVADSPWTLAILVGLLLAAYMTVQEWYAPGNHQLGVPILAALALGYVYSTRDASALVSGLIAGVLAALPIVWPVVAMLRYIPGFEQPLWFGAVQAIVALQLVGFLLVFVAITTMLSALLGAWIGKKFGKRRAASMA